jgi:putative oxidoreductase
MKIAVIVARIFMSLLFLMSASVYFFNWMPEPVLTGNIKTFNDGIAASGYLMLFIKLTELACALSFITGRYVTLATVVIFPVVLNIVLYHIFLMPQGIPMVALLLLANLFLAFYYRKNYVSLFTVK